MNLFCSKCGQKNTDILSFKELFRDLVDNVFSFDSRFFITFKYLITKPGFLTIEYWEGRRMTYLPPLRLYLVISIVYFFIASTVNSYDASAEIPFKQDIEEGDGIRFDKTSPEIFHLFADTMNRGFKIIYEKGLTWNDLLLDDLQATMFLLMPIMGLVFFMLYRKNNNLYAYHLITVLHFHCFYFFISTILSLIPLLGLIMPLVFIYYTYKMLLYIYNESWIKTTFKFLILLSSYGLIMLSSQFGLVLGKVFFIGINN